MFIWILAALAADAGTAAPGEALERAADTVLVTDLRPVGIAADEATALTAEVAQILARSGSWHVITTAEINQVASLQKQLDAMGCMDQACIARLSRVANAGLVLSGSVGRVGDLYTLTLSLIDVESTRTVGSATRSAGSLEELRASLEEAVHEAAAGTAPGSGEAAPRYHLPEGRTTSFAVLDLKPLGISASVADNLTEVLAAELKTFKGASVISRSDISSMLQLEASRDMLACEDSGSCLAEIGGALGVDQLIVGNVGRVGERFVVSLRIVDARNPAALSRVNESFEGQESQLVPAVKHATRTLLDIETAASGRLMIEASVQQARVSVDGEHVGLVPVTDLHPLDVGKHSLLVTRAGYFDWRSDVYVAPNTTSKVWAEMQERPVHWLFWGFVGVTGAAAAGGGIASSMALSEDHKAQKALAASQPGFMHHRDAASSWALTANVFWVSTAVTAVGTLVAGLLTNWE